MTSRPGPGIPESLQHRGSGHAYALRRWPGNPPSGQQDTGVDNERPLADERTPKAKAKGKAKQLPLEGIQTTTRESPWPNPRGKPQAYFSNDGSSNAGPSNTGPSSAGPGIDPSTSSLPAFNLPVPPRPGSSAPGDGSQQRHTPPGGSGVRDDPTTTLQEQNAPVEAVVFPEGQTVDLFPWTGGHPEDVLSEPFVKTGISYKSQIMNEQNTARPSLWSNLKNKSAISTLSTLFVAVLEKRQSNSRLSAPHTFKPPPRLTLRDSTRETWLHDLANPTIPLRRLSRTIPHGVSGKVLLEHCLNKDIPIPRAMWLAKCVGINEMRAHKRKGQAGAITWVRGWTSSVVQFLEATIATIGKQGWKPRITYALQLVSHLFKEHLLEEEQFLDWVLRSLESSVPERLFLWLLMVNLPDFWQKLIASRRRGKRLAESLMTHLERLYALEDTQHLPILDFVQNVVIKVVFVRPACCLLPKTWDRFKTSLYTLAQRRPDVELNSAILRLEARNKRIVRSSGLPSKSQDPSSRLYRILDAVDYNAQICMETLAFECVQVTSDGRLLVSAALQWASSLYRQGPHRVYLVSRLLRKWSNFRADVYEGILAYLPNTVLDCSIEPRLVFSVVAELVRSKTFPLGRFFQWIIATGSLSKLSDLSSSSSWPLRLMTELPITGLTAHAQILRHTLLHDTIHSTEAEEQSIAAAESVLKRQLPGLFAQDQLFKIHNPVNLEMLSPCAKREVASWLRRQVAASTEMIDCVPTKERSIEKTGAVCMISLSDFHVIRAFLERYSDLSILADIVGIVASSLDGHVLSACADTLHLHYKSFRAIGAFESLFEKIAMRYAAIRTIRVPERDLLVSLSNLAQTSQADPQLVSMLQYDITIDDHKYSVAACSPASDNANEGDTEDEIERILASGTSMDLPMMNRVFGKITANLEEQVCKGRLIDNFASRVYRLRNFEEMTFDRILASWLASLLMSHQGQLLSAAIPPLIAWGCLSMSRFLKTVKECVRSRRANYATESFRIALEGLDRILPCERENIFCRQQDLYRYRLEQYKYCRRGDGGILEFVRELAELNSSSSQACQKQLEGFFSSNRLLSVLRYFAIYDTQSLSGMVVVKDADSHSAAPAIVKSLLDRLLDPANRMNLPQKDFRQQVTTIVACADELTLPYCRLQFQHIFSSQAEDAADSVSAALLMAIKYALEHDLPCWSDLISGLDSGLMDKIREHAEREIINVSTFMCRPTLGSLTGQVEETQALVRKYVSVINATTSSSTQEAHASLLLPLIERLKGAGELLSKSNDESLNTELCYWLDAVLRLVVVHGPGLIAKAGNQHSAALLWSLRILVNHPGLEISPGTVQYVFDVATLLSDSILDAVRTHLTRMDSGRVPGPRSGFIFGTVTPPDGWLNLARPAKTPQSTLTASPSPYPSQPASTSQSTPAASSPQLHSQTTSTSLNSPVALSPQSQPQPQSQQSSSQSPHQNQQQSQQQPSPSAGSLQRSMSQQHLQQQKQLQAQNRNYPQFPQQGPTQRRIPPLQPRKPSSGRMVAMPTREQVQQMQALAQQRSGQSSGVQQQRAPMVTGRAGSMRQENIEMKTVPFPLNRWEILPDSGGNPLGNETAVSMTLFGARRV